MANYSKIISVTPSYLEHRTSSFFFLNDKLNFLKHQNNDKIITKFQKKCFHKKQKKTFHASYIVLRIQQLGQIL